MESSAIKRRLILHFDVNKTVVMRDTSSNKPSEEVVLADIIAETAWGKVEQREKEGGMVNLWICTSDILAQDPPAEGLISFK